MSQKIEAAIGIGAVILFLFWAYSQKEGSQNVTASQPGSVTDNAPSPYTRGGLIIPPAPNLNFVSNQAAPVNNIINVVMPQQPQTSPSPCACSSCGDNGANQVTKTLTDFAKSLTTSMGAQYDAYLKNLSEVLTPNAILSTFASGSSDKANADLIASSMAQAAKTGTGINLTVGDVRYNARQEQKDFYTRAGFGGTTLQRANNITLASLNTYTPGRVVSLVSR